MRYTFLLQLGAAKIPAGCMAACSRIAQSEAGHRIKWSEILIHKDAGGKLGADRKRKLCDISLLLGMASCGIALLIFWVAPHPFIDDAFITFRYAHNLSHGLGFAYNSGDPPILGTTAPLWTLALAAIEGSTGIAPPRASLVLSILACLALSVGAYTELLRDRFGRWSGLAVFLLLPIPVLYSAIFSGLETWMYSLATVTGLYLLIRGKPLAAVVCGCTAALLRPDGLILVGLSIFSAFRTSRRSAISSLLLIIFLLGPWTLYSLTTFGSLLPHSIIAKKVVHPGDPLGNLLLLSEVIVSSPPLFISFLWGAAGVLLAARTRHYLPVLAWLIAYGSGLVFSGVKPIFFWYLTPAWIILTLFGSAALYDFFSSHARPPLTLRQLRRCFVIMCVSTAALSLGTLGSIDSAQKRDLGYQALGPILAQQSSPGERFYLCETGILGYHLLNRYIIDSSGINSPEVYKIRRAAQEYLISKGLPMQPDRFTDWSAKVIRTLNPDWIVSPRAWCQLGVLEEEAWFKDRYERIMLINETHLRGIGVYRKKQD